MHKCTSSFLHYIWEEKHALLRLMQACPSYLQKSYQLAGIASASQMASLHLVHSPVHDFIAFLNRHVYTSRYCVYYTYTDKNALLRALRSARQWKSWNVE